MSIKLINELHPAPWIVAPLDGKYYGTKILDVRGDLVLKIWKDDDGLPPSRREERVHYDPSHFESDRDFQIATFVCETFNGAVRQADAELVELD